MFRFAVSDEDQEYFDIPASWGSVRLSSALGELWSIAFNLDAPQQERRTNSTLIRWADLVDTTLHSGKSISPQDRADLFATHRWQALSPVSRTVLEIVSRIPCGQFLTYSQIAEAIEKPKAVRAVARILASNPFPILIPCHRIVSKSMLETMDMTNPKSFEGAAFGGRSEFVPIGAWLRINDLAHV